MLLLPLLLPQAMVAATELAGCSLAPPPPDNTSLTITVGATITIFPANVSLAGAGIFAFRFRERRHPVAREIRGQPVTRGPLLQCGPHLGRHATAATAVRAAACSELKIWEVASAVGPPAGEAYCAPPVHRRQVAAPLCPLRTLCARVAAPMLGGTCARSACAASATPRSLELAVLPEGAARASPSAA